MVNVIAAFAALIITLPLVVLFLLYVIMKLALRDIRRSFFLSVDLSTILFIIAVHYLLLVMMNRSFLWLILLILLLLFSFTIWLQWTIKKQIYTSKILKQFWRSSFLLFFVSYFILLVTGLIHRIMMEIS